MNRAAPPPAETDQLVALFNAGRHAELESRARSLIERYPNSAFAWKLLGVSLHLQGKDGLNALRKTAELSPDDAGAHSNLGNALRELGQLDGAIASYQRALEIKPDFALAHYNLGLVLHDLGQANDAAASYRRALQIEPDYADAHNNLGVVLKDLGRIDDAVASYHRALRINPDFAEAHNNLGNALRDLGQLDAAVASCRRALQIDPAYADAHSNLGNVLKDLGQLDDAIASCRRALEINPDLAQAHLILGTVLHDLGQLDDAVASYGRALQIDPNSAETQCNLGIVLHDLGQLDEPVAHYHRALEIRPDFAYVHSNLLFTLNYDSSKSGEEILAVARDYEARFGASCRAAWQPHANAREAGRRLKIGYVSPDFRNHAVAHFALPLMERHDKSRFEIYCYYNHTQRDEFTQRVESAADHWIPSVGLGDEAMAQRIREHQIDILVDLAGHTAGNRLLVFARKPAPLQVTYLGYPGTTGLAAMDYRITDGHADPAGSDAYYSERLLRLPHSLWCYQAPDAMPDIAALPALQNGHVTFGSLNNFNKIRPECIELWATLLRRLPQSRLLLVTVPEGETRRRLAEQFSALGIAAERLEFQGRLERKAFHRMFQKVDIALDPFPVNGGTTTCESLWMGVPVMVLVGKRFVSRASYSFLCAVGREEFAAQTPEGYVELALNLAGDLEQLAATHAGLRAQVAASRLTDAAGFTRNLEAVYRRIWAEWCASSR